MLGRDDYLEARRVSLERFGTMMCWICLLPTLRTKNSNSGVRESVDHVLDEVFIAHAWCNSRRGSRDQPLDYEIRKACQNHILAKYKALFTPEQIEFSHHNLLSCDAMHKKELTMTDL